MATRTKWLAKRKTVSKQKQMSKFSYTITIEASTEQEADKKMKALTVLASKLKTNEVEKLAHIVKNDPVKTAMAKAYLGL